MHDFFAPEKYHGKQNASGGQIDFLRSMAGVAGRFYVITIQSIGTELKEKSKYQQKLGK